MKILKKYVSILLITAMMFTSPFSVWANTTDISTEKVVNSVKNSLHVDYKLEQDTVIEISSFTDVDNEYVEMWRSVEKDGSGKLIYTKANKSFTIELSDQDYDLFVSLLNACLLYTSRCV